MIKNLFWPDRYLPRLVILDRPNIDMKRTVAIVTLSAALLLWFFPLLIKGQYSDVTKIEKAVRQVSKEQLLSVVSLKSYDTVTRKASDAMFSGVVVDKEGYMLTSGHSMMPGQVYQITFPDGKTFMAKGLGRILSHDAGLLKITSKGVWPFSEMGLSNSVKENDLCIGISYVGTLGQSKPNVRFGYVVEPLAHRGSFQSTCLMEPGDSGGPVFDL